jgi:hypothetical protein
LNLFQQRIDLVLTDLGRFIGHRIPFLSDGKSYRFPWRRAAWKISGFRAATLIAQRRQSR